MSDDKLWLESINDLIIDEDSEFEGVLISPYFFSNLFILSSSAFENAFAWTGDIIILDLTLDFGTPGKTLIKSKINSANEWVTTAKLT